MVTAPLEKWRGIFPVVPTPLREDESLDGEGLGHLIDFYAAAGCHGLVVLGSGGEYPYFSFAERVEIVGKAVSAAQGRVSVMVGVGFCGYREAAEFIRAAETAGADGFLVALPTYYPIRFEDALNFYKRLAEVSDRPLFYYHFPQITGLVFSRAQMARILNLPGIAGVKESSLNVPEMRAHWQSVTRREFALFVGVSLLLLEALELGGAGAICPIAAVAPKLVVECYQAWEARDLDLARSSQKKIRDLIPLMNTFAMPAGLQKAGLKLMSRLPFSLPTGNRPRQAVIKEAIRQLGHPIRATVRSPLPQITEPEQRAIGKLLARAGLRLQ